MIEARSKWQQCYPERTSSVLRKTMERCNHPDGDIVSLLQVVDLVEGILKVHYVENVKDLPWNRPAVKALEGAGFKTRTVMQIWQNIAQITETLRDSELPLGKKRSRTDK